MQFLLYERNSKTGITKPQAQSPGNYERKDQKGVFWPRDLLPAILPGARVFTWGYDVDVNHIFSSASQNSVFQHAGNLLVDLTDARQSDAEKVRPLIFVAHSLGGIVVKDALSQSRMEKTHLRDILPATIGVCSLGTPHRGAPAATLGRIAFEISKVFLQSPNTTLLRALEANSDALERLGRSFSQIIIDRKIKVATFTEELLTNGVVIVDKSSSIIGDGLEVVGSIPSNHVEMAKFDSDADVGFRRVSAALKRWANGISPGTVPSRFSGYDNC